MRRQDTVDGRTRKPVPGWPETWTPRPLFGEHDRERLTADPHLRPYAAITQDQVAALLWACGEHFGRIFANDLEGVPALFEPDTLGPEMVQARRDLRRAYAGVHHGGDPPAAADSVFNAAEQHELSYHKWVRGSERLTREQLVRLLRALDRYAALAPQAPLAPCGSGVAVFPPFCRCLDAHNALISFRERPFTFEEYRRRVRAVIAMSRGPEPMAVRSTAGGRTAQPSVEG